MEKFTKALGIKRQLLTAYHPQIDGQTERINQEIGGLLGPFHFWIFPLGLIALFPFYSTFDVATTIVELQQLHRNASVIKGIITLTCSFNVHNELKV